MSERIAAERPMIGAMTAERAAAYLELCGEAEIAAALRSLPESETLETLIASGQYSANPWDHTTFSCAYLPPELTPNGWGYLSDARQATPDTSLVGKNLRITLDQLRIYKYPGSGFHNILFDFSAAHQEERDGPPTPVHFSQKYRVQNGQGAGVSGYPIFNGLRVSPAGVQFSGSTTNVSNDGDEKLLSFLDTDVFKNGLGFINGINPALPPITNYAVALLKFVWSRNQNVLIHSFDLGLDVDSTLTRPKLRVGSYVVVQAPPNAINWGQWVWDPGLGRIRWWNNNGELNYNYIILGVSAVAA